MKKIKNILKRIPLLATIVALFNRKKHEIPVFTSTSDYWETRYGSGGNSGAGSYNILAEYKGEIINDFVKEKNIKTVIEFGSGDGNQLKFFNFENYIGFDISKTTINNCRLMYESDSTKRFEVLDDYKNEKADLVLSLDVIYHLIEEAVYSDYLEKLFSSSNKFVIIYSSNEDNHKNNNVAGHVKHRKFTNWIDQNVPNFKLIKHIPNKYPFSGNNNISSYADFYIFEAQDL